MDGGFKGRSGACVQGTLLSIRAFSGTAITDDRTFIT